MAREVIYTELTIIEFAEALSMRPDAEFVKKVTEFLPNNIICILFLLKRSKDINLKFADISFGGQR